MQLRTLIIISLAAASLSATAQKSTKQKRQKQAATSAQKAPESAQKLQGVNAKDFSYAFGVLQGSSLKQYLIQNEGVDSAYIAEAASALAQDPETPEAKRAMARAAGLKIAAMNRGRIKDAINQQATGKADTTYLDMDIYTAVLQDALLGRTLAISTDSAQKVLTQQAQYAQETFRAAQRQWLADNLRNGAKNGVKQLPSGLQYKVLVEGHGAVATDSSDVEVNYEGRLTDGTVFDSSYRRNQTATFKPSQVIKGWSEALQLMPEGSVWELYVPSELGYGERGGGQQIPANATLIFKVEVVKVKTNPKK